MNISRFKFIAVRIEELWDLYFQLRNKQKTTKAGSNTWHRYQAEIDKASTERLALWKELEEAAVK